MINKFGSLFAGHVDMDNVGLGGTAVNDRWFSNEHLLTAFDKGQALCQLMDRAGYDTFWTAEHHFQREGYECFPNILLYSLHLAHVTTNIKLGCAFNVTPMWNPLRLAEVFAMVDYLTGGRVIFGVGRGYHTREVEVFDSPLRDQAANRDLFEEQVDVIFKALNEESFSHHGKHFDFPPAGIPYRGYELENITLVPRPVHRPIECWQPIQSATQRGLDFMVKHGIKGIIGGGVAEGGPGQKIVESWTDANARAGKEIKPGEDLIIGFHFQIAETKEKAIKEASKWYEENLKMFGPLRMVRGMTEEQIRDIGDPKRAPHAGFAPLEQFAQGGTWLYGPPEQIIEQLLEVEARLPGLEHVDVSHPIGTPQSVMLEQLEWFAKDVMPAFKDRVATPPVAA